MPFTKPDGTRDYKRELAWEHKNKPKRVKDRAARNKARKELGLKVGDPRQADHKKELVSGGKNTLANLHAISAKANLEKEARRKKKVSK